MISEKTARKYCREDITLIKNYAEAVADKTRTWCCHHINGEPFTGFCKKDLKKMNMYVNRPASELVFVTRKMHDKLHGTCKKLCESNKGKTSPLKGKTLEHRSEDTRKKISESLKGKTPSEETRQKMSESHKGKYWFNNGEINKRALVCPAGFVPGRIYNRRNNE